MIVPSRSTKTAGESASVMFAVFSETGHQFVSRHGCGSKFADHNGASVVGDFCSFNGSRFADESEGKQRYGSVASAGDIENLPCLGWDVMRRFVLLKKHHSMFAERHEDIFRLPFLEERFAGASQIGVFFRSFIWFAPGDA